MYGVFCKLIGKEDKKPTNQRCLTSQEFSSKELSLLLLLSQFFFLSFHTNIFTQR